jgi:hypothetical protein
MWISSDIECHKTLRLTPTVNANAKNTLRHKTRLTPTVNANAKNTLRQPTIVRSEKCFK